MVSQPWKRDLLSEEEYLPRCETLPVRAMLGADADLHVADDVQTGTALTPTFG